MRVTYWKDSIDSRRFFIDFNLLHKGKYSYISDKNVVSEQFYQPLTANNYWIFSIYGFTHKNYTIRYQIDTHNSLSPMECCGSNYTWNGDKCLQNANTNSNKGSTNNSLPSPSNSTNNDVNLDGKSNKGSTN